MVIGMDIGTTTTAAMATIGGNIQARRTGMAHVLYNLFTGTVAFILLTPYFKVLESVWPRAEAIHPEIGLVSFHTFYNLLCALTILPFTRKFANFVEWLFPEHGNPLTKRLDPHLLSSPDAAIQAVTATLEQIAHELSALIASGIRNPRRPINQEELASIDDATSRTRDYLEQLRIQPSLRNHLEKYTSSIHILDHLQRMSRRAGDQNRISHIRDDAELEAMAEVLLESIALLRETSFPIPAEVEERIQQCNHDLKTAMRRYRVNSLRRTADGESTAKITLQRMDAARSLRRVGYHVWRIADHAAAGPVERES